MPGRAQFELERDAQKRVSRDLLDQKAASSRPGQVYHTMTSLADRMTRPGYQNMQADIDQLKGLRRDWNRNQKYTPMGMQVSGATTPGGAQDEFVNMSRALRQGNNPAYTKMYPVTGNFMNIMDKGGLWGSILSEIGKWSKDRAERKGILGNVDDTLDEEKEYVEKTFGTYPTDVHPGFPETPLLMDEESALTREEQIQELVDEKQRQIDNFETTASSDILDEAIESQWPTKDPVVFDDYVSDRLQRLRDSGGEPKDDISKYEDYIERAQDPLPFDEGREDFIRRQNEYVAPIPAPLGTPDPQGDFYFDAENWDDTRSDMYIPPLDADQGAFTSLSPFDDSYREKGIMNAMREPYAPREDYTMPFPPRGPHDPFDPDQQYFENRDEYDSWLRRQRLGL